METTKAIQIVDYSDKALAVIGDTKQFAESLKELGGRFNRRLSCGPGWIFSKKMADALQQFINGGGQPKQKDEPNPLEGARVYVGTYGKYASGSIEGGWLNLKDYKNRDEFYAACRQLHKNERDPEFMFQDWEGIPSWMIGESHIDEAVWQQKPEKEEKGMQSKAEIRALLEKYLRKDRDIDYYTKLTALAIVIDGRLFRFNKQTIETRFCHADEPEEAVKRFYKEVRTYEYFHRENISKLDYEIEKLEKATLGGPFGAFICEEYDGGWGYGTNRDKCYIDSRYEYRDMDEPTRQAILAGLRKVRASFDKRLAAWWKKYGPDKLTVWTYWAEA